MIKRIIIGPVETNCYFLINESTEETVIFDPAYAGKKIADYVSDNGLKVKAICLTHGHYDHIMGIKEFKEIYNVPVYACREEEKLLGDGELNHSSVHYDHAVTVKPDILLDDGEEFQTAGIKIKMIHTPGHTHGRCCYYIKDMNMLISGDTLFEGSVGRTDLPTGSMSEMMRSLSDKLSELPDDTDVYPGHGGYTTIGDEKKYNPYFE